jgi:hypothetical protein
LGNILDKVRESTRQVVNEAQLVKVNPARLEAFAQSLKPTEVIARYYYAEDFHYNGGSPFDESDGRRLLDYVFTVTALNFGSGFSPLWKLQRGGNSTYKNTAATLKAEAESGRLLDANWAAGITVAELATLFGVAPDFPLVQMFAASLNELGRFVVNEFQGDYADLLDSLPTHDTAAALVELLTSHLSHFNDQAVYNGKPVYFFKRAQILANDLYLAFNGVGFGDFPDVKHLTSFADNLIPHLFRVENVLEYDKGLADRIEKGELIPAGSAEEIEIRAAGVYCVEETVRLLNQQSGPDEQIFPAQLDVYLWNKAQAAHYKSRPRHLSQTYFY